ncbi:enterochelin esterase [Streptomyces boninensis]|uniref:enterochelin esterase n=1 Tax=Streptomyces boninensis TaxID=2039455 RepID=UPI003B225562
MPAPAPSAAPPAKRHPPRIPRPQPVPRATTDLVTRLEQGDIAEEAFWEEAARAGTPLVEPTGAGDAIVTFLWRGTEATRAVRVTPNKLADPRDPDANLMTHVPGTHTWHWSIRMRRDWRATYTLAVDEGDGSQHRPDPYNTRTLAPRWAGPPVPYVELPDAPRATDWQRHPDTPRGTVTEHTVASARLGNERRVWLYEPPGAPAPAGPLPLLVLFDGEMWQPGLDLAALLDNLIAAGRIPPLAALLPESLGADTRYDELACSERFLGFLTDELLPWAAAEARLPLTTDPSRTVIAGQSLGGLAAAYAAYAAPHRFGAVLAQSGSFWWPNGPGAEWLTARLAEAPRLPVRFRLSAGEQEWVALPACRRLRDTLAAKGYDDVEYREFNGGHDYLCWRTELTDGLCALLGDPA